MCCKKMWSKKNLVCLISFVLVLGIGSNAFGYKVQSGRVEITDSTLDVPITAVSSTSRAFVLLGFGTGWRNGSSDSDDTMVRGWLQATDNVRIARNATSNSSWVSYQVIECDDQEFIVYRGSGSMTTGESSKVIDIGATVDSAKCLAYVTADGDRSSTGYYNQSMLTARVSSATQVTIERNSSANVAPNFNWIVVEFDTSKIDSIQSGSVEITNQTHSSPKTVSISSIDPDTSILIYQWRTSQASLTNSTFAGNISSSTQLKFYKYAYTANNADIEWCVIDFGGDGAAQRGEVDKTGDSTWDIVDVTLSPDVDTSATMHFHGVASNGTGTAHPRGFATAKLTSDTNLQIQRMYKGQTSWIEWQVLELPSGGPQPPGQASNPSPANGATDVSTTADLSWTAGSGSTSSDVYFGTSSPGTFQGNQAGTTYDPGTMNNDTTYYWRIDEVNAAGTTTGVVWSFTTEAAAPPPPGQASNPSPANGATDVSTTADLSWTAGSDATSHDVYFGTSSPGTFQGNQAGTTYDPGTMNNDTTYYWRIDEVNSSGTTTGVVWSFTTIVAPPGQASNPSPANGATDVSTTADLSWTAGSGATSHDVYFGTSSPGTFQGNQVGTTFDTGTMANDTTYYWRIDEVNAAGTTTGVVWSFTTTAAPPPPPGQASNPSPADGATSVNIYADLSWTAGSDATSHDVHFGTSSPGDFQGSQTDTTYDPGTMAENTTYYWRIDEKNAVGTTTGVVWSFTTGDAPDLGGYIVAWGEDDSAEVSNIPTGSDFVAVRGGRNHGIALRIDGTVAAWGQDNFGQGSVPAELSGKVVTDIRAGYAHNLVLFDDGTVYNWGGRDKPGPEWEPMYPVPSELDGEVVIAIAAGGNHDLVLLDDGTLFCWGYDSQGPVSDTPTDSGYIAVAAGNYHCMAQKADGTVVCWGYNNYGQSNVPAEAHGAIAIDAGSYVSMVIKSDAIIAWGLNSYTPSGNDFIAIGAGGYGKIALRSDGTVESWLGGNADPEPTTPTDSGYVAVGAGYGFWMAIQGGSIPPGQAKSPNPGNGATGVSTTADLSWVPGSGATSHDVYFGTSSPGTYQGNQVGSTTYDPGTMTNDTTYYWRIDEVNTAGTTTGVVWSFTTTAAPPPPPGQASSPSPADGATTVSVTADLSWTAGSDATSHDVHFGTTSPGTFRGNQTGTSYDPGLMSYETTYYWRIDEVNSSDTTTGNVWSFTTEEEPGAPPGQASSPSPSNGATDVDTNADLSWTAGSGATSHDVYFGTDSSPDSGEFIQNQAGTTYDPGTMANSTTYYWRIDEVNAYGTTTGDVWSFTTGTGAPPSEIAFDAVSTGVNGGGDDVLSWSHTIGSGSNRILVVALANEDNKEEDMQVSSIKFNGIDMTYVSGSSIYYDPIKVDLYYILESDLPSAGTYTIQVDYDGNVSDLIGGAISLSNVKQQAPEAVATNSDGDNNVISTNITTQTNGAWVVDVVAEEKSENFITTTSGMVERWDENTGAHTGAGSTKPVASAGSTTMSWEFDGGTDAIIHSAAAFAPAP